MTFKSKVRVTVTLSSKTAYISAMPMVWTLKLSGDVSPHQSMVLRAKVKVTRTFSTKKLNNLAMLGDRTLKQKGCWSSPVDDTRTKVMVKVTVTFSTKKLIISAVLEARTLELGMLVLTSR